MSAHCLLEVEHLWFVDFDEKCTVAMYYKMKIFKTKTVKGSNTFTAYKYFITSLENDVNSALNGFFYSKTRRDLRTQNRANFQTILDENGDELLVYTEHVL